MSEDMSIDLNEARRTFGHADVISIFFPLLGRSLVMDLRTSPGVAPLVRVMPMVATPEERLRTLQRLRPHLPKPERVVLVPWTRYVHTLRAMGLWDVVRECLAATGSTDALDASESALRDLARLERSTLRSLIRGEGCQTIWARAG